MPNATVVVESLTTGAVPVPVSEIVCGEPLALLVRVTVAPAVPRVFGSKCRVIRQEAPTSTLAPQLLLRRNDE